MFRVLLSSTGKAYIKNCSFDDYDFMEELQNLVDGGNAVVLADDLDTLEDALNQEYEIILPDDGNF